ncbi:MAG: DUF6567 family protein [Bacteroidota bacterium]
MKKLVSMLSSIVLVSMLGGCASTGLTVSSHRTDIELSENNYKVIATNVIGEADSDGIIGLSFGVGQGALQFSLIPIERNRTLYKNAMENLWSNFEVKNGSPINRTLALVNVRFDS